jgi:hypothetical protein
VLLCPRAQAHGDLVLLCPGARAHGDPVLLCPGAQAHGDLVLLCPRAQAHGDPVILSFVRLTLRSYFDVVPRRGPLLRTGSRPSAARPRLGCYNDILIFSNDFSKHT